MTHISLIARALVTQRFVPGGVACDKVFAVGVLGSWCGG